LRDLTFSQDTAKRSKKTEVITRDNVLFFIIF
jgi:hypothetical protein